MIGSFRDDHLERFWTEGRMRGIPSEMRSALRRKLAMMAAATDLNDLRVPPANHLEALRGDRRGQHSIRVNRQWRLVFQWRHETAWEIELVDYH
jgi:proteic killer suppression protein